MSTAIAAYIDLADSAAERLAPDESVVEIDDFQTIDFWKPKRAIKDVTVPRATGPFGSQQVGAVMTDRRLLLFRLGGLTHSKAEEILLDVPLAEVEAIRCESHWWKSFELFLGLGGTEYPFLIAHIGRGRRFEQAHNGLRAAPPAR
jgi:hypothetical protein